MKIFISWSGERSRIVAEGLNSWLPKVIQALKPFYSPEIEKGTRGISEINNSLEGTSFGIICLTPDNLDNKWIHYEAGALSKIEGARIWTLLNGLGYSEVTQPLAQFQHTLAQKDEIYKLLESINIHLAESLDKAMLRESFERWWSDLEEKLLKAQKFEKVSVKNERSEKDILIEILETVRNQARNPEVSIKEDKFKLLEPLFIQAINIKVSKSKNAQAGINVDVLRRLLEECFPKTEISILDYDLLFSIEIHFEQMTYQESAIRMIENFKMVSADKFAAVTLTTSQSTEVSYTFS